MIWTIFEVLLGLGFGLVLAALAVCCMAMTPPKRH